MKLTIIQGTILKLLASSQKIRWTAQELSQHCQEFSQSDLYGIVEQLQQRGFVDFQPIRSTTHSSFTGLCLTNTGRNAAAAL